MSVYILGRTRYVHEQPGGHTIPGCGPYLLIFLKNVYLKRGLPLLFELSCLPSSGAAVLPLYAALALSLLTGFSVIPSRFTVCEHGVTGGLDEFHIAGPGKADTFASYQDGGG
jgi:hypothetical protein